MPVKGPRCIRCDILLRRDPCPAECDHTHGAVSGKDPDYCEWCVTQMYEEFETCLGRTPENFQEVRSHELRKCTKCAKRKRMVRKTTESALFNFWEQVDETYRVNGYKDLALERD